jgi:TolA-binding protein
MTMGPCPTEEELSLALEPDADGRVSRHAATCPRCHAIQDGLRDAIERVRALPEKVPDRARRDHVRAALLAQAALDPVRPRGRARWIAGASSLVVAAMAAVVLLHVRRSPEPPRSRAAVIANSDARWERMSPLPWETLRLWDGTIDVDVQPLGPGERMRVQVGESEVEVRGTRFQVTARADRLVAVDVTHGRVEVRTAGAPIAVLGAGQAWHWSPELAIAPAPPATTPTTELEPVAAPTQPPTPRHKRNVHQLARRLADGESGVERALPPTREEHLYDDAWDLLRERRFDEAARAFERVVDASRTGPLAEGAAFWSATALARGGATAEAASAFRQFLQTYRQSSRRGEASAILAWLLVDVHRYDEATPLFREALTDPRDSVRASARDGLDAIARGNAKR